MRGIKKDLSSGFKECPKCLVTKSLECYHICKNGVPNGYCRECTTIKNRNRKYKVKKIIKDGFKVCTSCKQELEISKFYTDSSRDHKPRPSCKECEYNKNKVWNNLNREYLNSRSLKYYYKSYEHNRILRNITSNKRRARLHISHQWSSIDAIKLVYTKARELSNKWGVEFHVDHVVPLRSKYVSGLHTESNLQILDRELNLKKQASSWPDMPIIDKELKQLAKEFYAKTN